MSSKVKLITYQIKLKLILNKKKVSLQGLKYCGFPGYECGCPGYIHKILNY